jgi:hypothetical protein
MQALLFGDQLENLLVRKGEFDGGPGVQKLPRGTRHEAVGIEIILFQLEGSKAPFQVPCPVVADPVAKDEVLRAGGRTDGVGLDKAESVDGFAEGGLRKQGGGEGVAAEFRETIWHKMS